MEMLDADWIDPLYEIGQWSVEALWLPLLAWTVVALPAYALVRYRNVGTPHVRYWSLVALVLSLPLGVVAASVAFFDAPAIEGFAIVVMPEIAVSPEATDPAFAWTTWHTAGVLALLAGGLALWRMTTLATRLLSLRAYRGNEGATPDWVIEETHSLARDLGLKRPVTVRVGATSSPFTLGWSRPLIVLPDDLLTSRADLRFTLTHELIHIRRSDFGLQVAEQFVGALFFIHPLVALIRRETTLLREITCDADVLARTSERSAYARLLYRFSTATAPEHVPAVGIFSRDHQMPKRIRAMRNYLSEHGLNRSKQRGIAVFGTLMIVAVVVVACSDALVDSGPDPADTVAKVEAANPDIFVVVEDMPELIGGLASIQENLHYPKLAKAAGIEGRVIVQFVVDEEGNVVEPRIVRGIGSGLDKASLAAVRTAKFKPGRQRGVAVPVKMSLPITFKLPNADGSQTSGGSVINVLINADGQLLVEDTPASLSTLVAELERRGLSSETVVSLRVDEDTPPGRITEVQNALRSTESRRIEYGADGNDASDTNPAR